MTVVMKFGGSSLKNAERVKNACSIIKSRLDRKPKVVCSAVGGITDKLIESAKIAANGESPDEHLKLINDKHHEILKDLKLDEAMVDGLLNEFSELIKSIKEKKSADIKVMDHVQSFGERMSCTIVAAYLSKIGIAAKACFAWDIGIITNDDFANAEPLKSSYALIKERLGKLKEIPIITGFIGKTQDGIITTMGRGGSDYTAAIVGSVLGSEEIEIWTDVDGIMTADPRIVKNAKTISQVSFAEASELAYFGAKVLHPKTILPAMNKNIPVRVLNTHNPGGKGTVILHHTKKSKDTIKAIACKKNVTIMNIDSTRMLDAHGFLAKVFDVFADYNQSVDIVSTSEVSISLTVDKEKNLDKVAEELKEIAEVKIEKSKATIGIVGEGMKHTKGIAGRIFTAMGKNGINVEVISQGASEINVIFVIENKDADKAVQVLHKEFFG